MSITISVTAMVFNYLYNLVFDKILVALNKPVHVRPAWMRGLHAVLFELSLLTMTVPFVAWWLDMTLWNALIADIGFALFFLVYAFAYNWVYDIVFPMPVPENV